MESVVPSGTSFTQTGSFSYNSSSNMKYGGIIKKSAIKQLRKDLSLLFSYVDSVTFSYSIVHFIVTFFRFFQYVGPSFCARFKNFWSKDDYSYQTVSIISIFFHLIPPDYRDFGGFYFMIIYIIILSLVNLILIVSAKYFQKSASLPSFMPPSISIYFATFGYLLHPIAIQLGFSRIGQLTFVFMNSIRLLNVLVLVILSILISIVYFWIYLTVASKSIMFKPNSLQSTTDVPQNLFFVSELIITILTSFAESGNKEIQVVFLIITALVYFVSILTVFCYGGIINTTCSAAYMATSFTSGLMCLVSAITIMLGKNGSMAYLIGFIIVLVVSFVLSLFILRKITVKHIELLDAIIDDSSEFDRVKSINNFVSVAISGFKIAHPVCINWQFLKLGIEKWPQNQFVWFIYAKFVAIYPEETQTLWWIYRNIVTNKIHGGAARTVKEQSMTIARQREPNLSPDLKNKLNSVSKHLTSTKHKLRHVWDLTIQGNVADMESATKRAIAETEQSDAELLHVLRQFPNNRFVTRQYARFCRELKADHKTYLDMIDKTRQLQRGFIVNKDQAHEFGLEAFDCLPDKLNVSRDNMSMNAINESITTSQIELDGDEENNQENDETSVLANRINSLVIPSTRYSIIIRLLIFIILFLTPAIVLIIMSHSFVTVLAEPLQHMFNLAMLRTYVYQIVAFSEEQILEMLDFFAAPDPSSNVLPESFGGSWKTQDQLVFITAQTTAYIQNVEKFRTIDIDNEKIRLAQSLIFDANLDYKYYTGTTPTSNKVTIQMAISDIVTQQSSLITPNGTIPNDIINSSVMLNPLMNHNAVVELIDQSIKEVAEYLSIRHNSYKNTFTIIIICVIVLIIIIYTVFTTCQLLWINSNKFQVYRCLTSLPKNAVSSLAENLRVLKKEENSSSSCANTEMNKQEDNILKIFVTGGTSSSTKWVDVAFIIVCTAITIGMHLGCTLTIGLNVIEMSHNLRTSCMHINNIQGAYGLEIGAQIMIVLMLTKGDPDVDPFLFPKSLLVSEYRRRIDQAIDYYHKARFGGTARDDIPYSGFDEGVAYAASKVECEDPYRIDNNFKNSLKCFTADLVFVMLEGLWNQCVVPYIQENKETLPWNDVLDSIWAQLIFPIYDALFEPMTKGMVDRITSELRSLNESIIPGVVLIIVVALFSEIFALVQAINIQTHIKNVLRLLLHVQPNVVMQTQKIMNILGGNFKGNKLDSGNRNAEFFHAVVMNLPDAVIVTNPEMSITSINASLTRICGLTSEQVIDHQLKEVLSMFSPNAIDLLNNESNGKPKSDSITFKKADNTELSLEATLFHVSSIHVVLLRDITQTVRYNTLINEEKTKSDLLLNSILPATLVKRVQAGEKNISFAVQSATIVFMDIVSFTPWCGSLPADKVMSTLNHLFKKLDSLSAKYPTMTKIKCIGDCYMAAGGVFSEVNQPSEHAKEVVSFGLDSLNAVEELNQEIGEKLQIRVGINTGGPIVAGVLGIGKPTFEILGPAINMAQQMEHHGVAMQVHISRSVYELVYGDTFVIKERGAVEVKGGKVITYLVGRK